MQIEATERIPLSGTTSVTTANEGLVIYSRPVNQFIGFSFQLFWSVGASTPGGTFVLSGSNDNASWEVVTYAPTQTVSGASGHQGINIQTGFNYKYAGISITSITGTFSLYTIFNGKGGAE